MAIRVVRQCAVALAAIGVVAAAGAADLRGALEIPSAQEIPVACEAALKSAEIQVKALEGLDTTKLNARMVLEDMNRLDLGLSRLDGPLSLAAEVHPDPALRKAAEACTLKLSAFSTALSQNEAIYKLVSTITPQDKIDSAARALILESFEASGVSLPPAKRERAKAIFDRIEALGQSFARNVRDVDTRLAYSASDLEGVPANYLATLKKNEQGEYLVPLDYPARDAVLESARKEASRQRFYMAFMQIGGQANLDLLAEVVSLRKELAGLFDLPSYAHWQLRTRMAGEPARVHAFLDEVKKAAAPAERAELARLTEAKRKEQGDSKAVLKRWDYSYYEKLVKQQRFAVDDEVVRKQFPTDPTINWVLDICARLYGLRFTANTELPRWHEEVRAYDVFDAKHGTYLSSFYLDLFPRDGKYRHAAAFPVRGVSTAAGQTPISVLVTNFSREGFGGDELRTLFHEFGHVLHGVLSRTRYVAQSGTAVRRDFVEAPSQMFEAWAFRPESTRRFSALCKTCTPIDPKLIRRIEAAERFNKGYFFARQRLLASYDMALAGPNPGEPLAVWKEMEGEMPLGYVEGVLFPANFAHLVRGYGAGYYGYMWSLVLALDMRSKFGQNFMDPAMGARYRSLILERGSEVPPMEMVREFLGREPDTRAFFKEINGGKG